MTEITDPCHPDTVRVAASHQDQARQIAAELAAIAATGMVLPGSITQRRTRCGRHGCACRADPPKLHGPYWQWTRKTVGRPGCRSLSPAQAEAYPARELGGAKQCIPSFASTWRRGSRMTRNVYPWLQNMLPGRSDSSSRLRSWAIFFAVLGSGGETGWSRRAAAERERGFP